MKCHSLGQVREGAAGVRPHAPADDSLPPGAAREPGAANQGTLPAAKSIILQ